ncbi:MAG TPA: aminotransferase class V-fold PLP-dependent enzyme [Propionibacteriaceae bacterium]
MTTDVALLARAEELDQADDLRLYRDRFQDAPGVIAYLDGNSLGRPLRDTPERLEAFVRGEWGTRLIRSWDERWMQLPIELGDRLGRVVLGAAKDQTVVADSTSVLLYKLIRAAVAARPNRREVVIEEGNFPTDRFILQSVAAESGLEVRWIAADPVHGVTTDDIAEVVSARTALVVLSHVDYRSGAVAHMEAITAVVKDTGALMLWDLSHSAGVVPLRLDEWGVDLAVGCTYKYLNGGPGSPGFAYVRSEHHGVLRQPIWGWMGAGNVFAMAHEYTPSPGIRQFISGTPPVLGMQPLSSMLDEIQAASVPRIRAKSRALTDLVVEAYDELLADLGVRLLSPRDADRRGGHVSLGHGRFGQITEQLWAQGVIPDFRHPDGIRIGLSPLSTSYVEAVTGVLAIRDALRTADPSV